MFSWKEFKEGKIAVHCDTEEKANVFLKGCDKQKIIWARNDKCAMCNNWAYYCEETCYCCFSDYGKLGYSPRTFYESKGIKTIDWRIKGEQQMKYKIGDKVKVKENLVVDKEYGDNAFIEEMEKDKFITIKKYCGNQYKVEENEFTYTDEMLDGLATDYPEIYITTDGKTTTAIKTLNGKVVKTSTAKCCPEDEFNFDKGAKLALERLNTEEPEKPKFVPHIEYLTGDRCGDIGEKTEQTAIFGENLYVGDVVELYVAASNEIYGNRIVAKGKDKSFIMGVKGCNFKNGISDDWRIRKVKSFKDLKDREIIDSIKVVLK